MAGARLQQLKLPTLIIDRNSCVGDNWRNRCVPAEMRQFILPSHSRYFALFGKLSSRYVRTISNSGGIRRRIIAMYTR